MGVLMDPESTTYPEPSSATAALVLGIFGLLMPLFAPFAWVIGSRELSAINKGQRSPMNRGTANAGRILGIVGTAFLMIGLAVGVLIIVFSIAFTQTLDSDPTVVGSAIINKPAPEMILDELGGDAQVRLSDHVGDVVVINFWASWASGARQEHASLDAAAADYADSDVTFFSVNTQDEDDQAISFLDQFGWSDETVYGIDHGSSAAFSYGVAGLPETFFVDRNGIVVGKVIGPVTYDLLTETIDRVLLGKDIDSVKTSETEQG